MHTELTALNQKIKLVVEQTEWVLEELYPDQNRTLDRLGVKDRQRLTNLLIWEQRLHLGLSEILTILLTHYGKFVRKTKNRGRGLPVSVRTLVSKTSEEVLRTYLGEKYPTGENIKVWKHRERERIVNQRVQDGDVELVDKYQPKTYNSLGAYMKDYIEWAERRKRMWEQLLDPRRKRKLYRGSPWG